MSTEPPYRQIAGQIRARIDGGHLSPGDRVPSARQITQEWAVAIATATKALAALRADGLVEVVPGVGTIVARADATPAPRRARRRSAQGSPDRDEIVRVAVDLADAEGLYAASLRRIAAELDVPTMALHRRIRGKDELLRNMIDASFAEAPLPPAPPTGVRTRLILACRQLWAVYRRHPWLASAMSITRPELAPHGMRYTEWMLRAMQPLGLPLAERMRIQLSLFGFVRGLAMGFETEAYAEQHTGLSTDEWWARQQGAMTGIVASGEFPMIAQVSQVDDLELSLDAVFEYGLPRILDGLVPEEPRR